MATYNVVSVRRTPNQLTGPTYVELGALPASALRVRDFKSGKPAECDITVSLKAIDPDTKTALLDLAAYPLEVYVYRDGTRIFAGPVLGGNVNGGTTVELNCKGRLSYLAFMLVETDKTFTTIDMFTIGKEFVNDWQAQDYGNFGVLTASIGTLGTTRSYEVPGATETPTVHKVLTEFAKGSFDWWVDQSTGNLEFSAARGSDLSGSVAVERGIAEAEQGFALGPGLLASEVYATGTSTGSPLTTTKSDTALRQSFGRAGVGTTHDPVTDANHLSDLAQADLDDRADVYFVPGGKLFEVPEATYENLEPGNTVEYSYDAGLGKQTLNLRVEKRELTVSGDGTERISVEFE
jgi:hypothetical protein